MWVTDLDQYHDTGETCLGGGMHCPSASTLCTLSLAMAGSSSCGVAIFMYNYRFKYITNKRLFTPSKHKVK